MVNGSRQASDRANINDVARTAGVSRATVSQVLRGVGRISPDTRARVARAIAEIGYVYNRAAANLRAGQSATIGIAIPELANPFFAELVAGAGRVLDDAGLIAAIVDTRDDPARQARFVTMLQEHRLGGAIVCPVPGPSTASPILAAKAFPPQVALLRQPAGGRVDHVGVDGAAGLEHATRHLLDLGHRTIGYVGGRARSASREDRLAGWRRALAEAGLCAAEDRVEPTEATIADGSRGITALLARVPGLTAVVCHQDIVAFGVTIGLRKLGLVPGADVSVVGFDDIAAAREWDPPLTTMSVTPATLGAEAARMLVLRMAEPEAPLRSVALLPRLVVRGSAGPAPPGRATVWSA